MLPCEGCKYKWPIPGDTHVQCAADWVRNREHIPTNQGKSYSNRWFQFPYNYDPGWGPDECVAREDKNETEG